VLSGEAGTGTATKTAGAGKCITRLFWCADSTAGSVAITPGSSGTQFTITVPASSGWSGLSFALDELPTGSSVTFTGLASWAIMRAAGKAA